MNTKILELSDEEILAIAGCGQIAPSAAASSTTADLYPQIINEPPP